MGEGGQGKKKKGDSFVARSIKIIGERPVKFINPKLQPSSHNS